MLNTPYSNLIDRDRLKKACPNPYLIPDKGMDCDLVILSIQDFENQIVDLLQSANGKIQQEVYIDMLFAVKSIRLFIQANNGAKKAYYARQRANRERKKGHRSMNDYTVEEKKAIADRIQSQMQNLKGI